MSEMLGILRLLIVFGGLLGFAFLILLSIPQSRLRDVIMPFVGWAVTALMAAYFALPLDIFPEILFGPVGYADDLIALAVGIASACSAIDAQKQLRDSR